jgi:hypothetical protein
LFYKAGFVSLWLVLSLTIFPVVGVITDHFPVVGVITDHLIAGSWYGDNTDQRKP